MILAQISILSKSIFISLFIHWFVSAKCECEKNIIAIPPTYTVTEIESEVLDQYIYESRLDWDSYHQMWLMRKYPVKIKDGGYIIKKTIYEIDQPGYIFICPNFWDDIFK